MRRILRNIWRSICDFCDEHIALSYVVMVVFMLGIILLLAHKYYNAKLEKFNDGHCACGGTFKYTETIPHDDYTGYMYTCNECGDKIELFNYVVVQDDNKGR